MLSGIVSVFKIYSLQSFYGWRALGGIVAFALYFTE